MENSNLAANRPLALLQWAITNRSQDDLKEDSRENCVKVYYLKQACAFNLCVLKHTHKSSSWECTTYDITFTLMACVSATTYTHWPECNKVTACERGEYIHQTTLLVPCYCFSRTVCLNGCYILHVRANCSMGNVACNSITVSPAVKLLEPPWQQPTKQLFNNFPCMFNTRGRGLDGQMDGFLVVIFPLLDSACPQKFRIWCSLRLWKSQGLTVCGGWGWTEGYMHCY